MKYWKTYCTMVTCIKGIEEDKNLNAQRRVKQTVPHLVFNLLSQIGGGKVYCLLDVLVK